MTRNRKNVRFTDAAAKSVPQTVNLDQKAAQTVKHIKVIPF